MTQFIEFIFTGPPDPNLALTLIQVVDDSGEEIQVGEWYNDGKFWRYQIPVELVPRMKVPVSMEVAERHVRRNPPLVDDIPSGILPVLNAPESDAQRRRRALKQRVTSSPRKEPSSVPPQPSPQSDWLKCPNCSQLYDPREHDLISCAQCGENRCTAICMPNPTDPCLDCQALAADPEEGGFDKRAKVEQAAPAGVFNAGFSPLAHEAVRDKSALVEGSEGEDNDEQ